MGMKFAEVNGKSQNRCVHGMVKLYKEKTEQGTRSAKERDIEVFGDDFAAVYFREKLCYHSRPEKSKIRKRIFLFDFTLFFIVKVCLPSL